MPASPAASNGVAKATSRILSGDVSLIKRRGTECPWTGSRQNIGAPTRAKIRREFDSGRQVLACGHQRLLLSARMEWEGACSSEKISGFSFRMATSDD
jgi:hypothetical protein